jgi:hypothetical protein
VIAGGAGSIKLLPPRAACLAGSAGKTIVRCTGLHIRRARTLTRESTTFSDTLAHALQTKLKRLLGNEPRLVTASTSCRRRRHRRAFLPAR